MLSSTRRKRLNRRTFLRGAASVALGTALVGPLSGPLIVKGQDTVKLFAPWFKQGVIDDILRSGANYATTVTNSRQSFEFPELIAGSDGITGLGNRKLELLFLGDVDLPDTTLQDQLRVLKREGVVGLIADPDLAMAQVVADEQMPTFSLTNVASSITKQGNEFVFRINNDAIQGLKALFASLANEFDTVTMAERESIPKNYIMLTTEYPGVEADLENVRIFAEEGVENEFTGRFKFMAQIIPSDEELTNKGLLERIKSLNLTPDDALILGFTPGTHISLIRGLTKEFPGVDQRPGLVFLDPMLYTLGALTGNLKPNELGGWRMLFNNLQFIPAVFKADAGFSSDFIGPFADDFMQHVGLPNALNALAFTAVHVWANVLNEAQSTDPNDIVAAAQNIDIVDTMMTNWDGISFGTTRFGDTNANVSALPTTVKLNNSGGIDVVGLPGGFTPSSAFAINKVHINESCLFNCVAIGINVSAVAIDNDVSFNQTSYDNSVRNNNIGNSTDDNSRTQSCSNGDTSTKGSAAGGDAVGVGGASDSQADSESHGFATGAVSTAVSDGGAGGASGGGARGAGSAGSGFGCKQ